MIVVDASVIAPAVADDGPDGDQARAHLRGQRLLAPELLDLEVTSVIRTTLAGGGLDNRRAKLALDDLSALDIRRIRHGHLLPRVWELRGNLTPYDAVYVALAETAQCTLLTADTRLGRAPGPKCRIQVLR
ncbi:MAG TPA: type II toxin-antitoxin system VapC family toxin [Acidimicrobiales bacterium]